MRSSIGLGAMSANATPAQLRNLSDFDRSLGLAFQVIDVARTKLVRDDDIIVTCDVAEDGEIIGIEVVGSIENSLAEILELAGIQDRV